MIRLALIPALLAVLLACGTETGNPEAIALATNARSSDATVQLTDDEEADVVLDTVWLRLDDVVLTSCDGEEQVVLVGLGFADHGGPEAALQTVDGPQTTWCRLQTALLPGVPGADEPPSVSGSAVGLTGRLDDRELRIVLDGPIAVDLTFDPLSPSQTDALLTFDVGAWLDLEALRNVVGDPVVIEEASHPTLTAALAARIASTAELWADVGGNGLVDPEDTLLSF